MNRLTTTLLLLAALASLWLAAQMHGPLLAARREHHLNWEEPLENSPPLVSFTSIALGGFRGILADVLWIRAAELQQQGKYFELVQLADWITKLEPRFGMVWAFHAWNMAYNVSVMLNDPADRWRWVRHGIELLRDEGLFYNPGDPQLYHQLGWLYQNKIGNILDQAHVYYKKAWADEMIELFGGPQPDFKELLAHPDGPRAVRIRTVYKLEPALMQEVDQTYGPLDWRLPQAHAIYWAYRGRRYAREFDLLQIDRMIFQSMQDAFWQGRLVYNKEEQVFIPAPNLALLPRVRRAYQQAIAAHPDQDAVQSAHRNFLRAAVMVLYENHHLAEAEEVFNDLHERYPTPPTEAGLEAFVGHLVAEQLHSLGQREAYALVEATWYQAYFWLALGDEERSAGYSQMARLVWQKYMSTLTDPDNRERTGLPPLDQIRLEARRRALESVRSAAARARLETEQGTPARAVP
ncbi:hypothetical protein HQ590_07945 [bacterium]|nr:hypothetical protein [bacterium]